MSLQEERSGAFANRGPHALQRVQQQIQATMPTRPWRPKREKKSGPRRWYTHAGGAHALPEIDGERLPVPPLGGRGTLSLAKPWAALRGQLLILPCRSVALGQGGLQQLLDLLLARKLQRGAALVVLQQQQQQQAQRTQQQVHVARACGR